VLEERQNKDKGVNPWLMDSKI